MSQDDTTHNSSDEKDDFDPNDSRSRRIQKAQAKKQRQERAERWERYVLQTSIRTGELCQGGLGFLCSEPAVFAGLCWPHFDDVLWGLRPTNSGSDSTTTATIPATIPAVAPRLAPVPATETCHLQDLILNNNTIADDGDATSEYDEAGAPPTEGGDEGQYESSEADDAGAVDYQEDGDPVLLLAASVPLPDAEEEEDLAKVDESAGRPMEPEDTGSTFHLPGVNWSWPSEASVAILAKKKAETRALLRIFPPAQGYTELASGHFKCNARARISPGTERWEAYDCSTTCKRQYDWRRHFLTVHLGGSRWEDVERQKKVPAEDSTSIATLGTKKPRAKREARQAQPLASTSVSASTSAAGPQPQVQPRKPCQKRRRQVIEDESSDDGGFEDRDQGDEDRKGKKARRW